LNAVVGEHGVNFVRNGFDKRRQEDGRGRSTGLLHKLYEGKFAGPVDRTYRYSLPSASVLRQCRCGNSRSDRPELLLVRLSPRLPAVSKCHGAAGSDERVRCGIVG